MGTTIREVDLADDREDIIRFLDENLPSNSDTARFEWLYLANPCGRARAWMAKDNFGRTIGVAAAFPRNFCIAGDTHRVWVLGDFCVAKEYRTLGPALQLQRAALESLTADEHAICYDFPSKAMMSIYGRLGIRALGTHIRHVKLLSVDEKVRKALGQSLLARPLSRITNWTLAIGQTRLSMPKDVQFAMQQSEFGKEFSTIKSAASLHPIKALHSAEYLNWRYIQHPTKQYCAVVARRDSQVVGYGVAEIDGTHSMLAELRATDTEKYLPGILAYLELLLRELDVSSISASVLQDCHLIPHLRGAGFHPREGVPVIAHAGRKTKSTIDFRDAKNWMLLYGDRDS
jgi:hypothetical protein